MLSGFFTLDPPFKQFDEVALVGHFQNSKDLHSVLYHPSNWPNSLRKNKNFKFTNVSLSKTKFSHVTFTECVFTDCLFIGATFEHVEFHRCKFINCNFYKVTITNCYLDPVTISLDRVYRKKHANIGVHLYQQIYDNSAQAGQYGFEREADIQFRKWKRWQLKFDHASGKLTCWEYIAATISSVVYEWVAGFGYKPLRFVVSTILLFTAFSFLNMKFLSGQLRHNGELIQSLNFYDSVFYTYSVMTALGFSSIIPETSCAKILTIFETLCGISWIGIFTALLVKRFIK